MKWLQIAIKSTSTQIERLQLLAIGVLMTEIDYKGKQNVPLTAAVVKCI